MRRIDLLQIAPGAFKQKAWKAAEQIFSARAATAGGALTEGNAYLAGVWKAPIQQMMGRRSDQSWSEHEAKQTLKDSGYVESLQLELRRQTRCPQMQSCLLRKEDRIPKCRGEGGKAPQWLLLLQRFVPP